MIDGRNVFHQPVKSDMRTYDSVRKIAIGQRDDYATGCLMDYNYFNNYYKIIAMYLSKQQAFDADPNAIQQIKFSGNLDRAEGATMIFITEGAKETVLDFSQGILKVL